MKGEDRMSHKGAKIQRKTGKGRLMYQVTINCFENGSIDVSNIPTHYDTAMQIMGAAQSVVHQQFMIAAMNGKINSAGNLIQDLVKQATAEEAAKILQANG